MPERDWFASDRVFVDTGTPVFHGAFSTFLAILMLSTAASYSMRTFFKQFASVVIFGSFNALAVLPVILSFIGPEPFGGRGVDGAEVMELTEVTKDTEEGEADDAQD